MQADRKKATNPVQPEEAHKVKNTAFEAATRWTRLARQLIVAAVLAAALFLGALASTAAATAWAEPTHQPHGGPDYVSITGARVGAPSEAEVSYYGGSHKHLYVEQQLYGQGTVLVPHVNTTVEQSR
jgi:hypothetical protein